VLEFRDLIPEGGLCRGGLHLRSLGRGGLRREAAGRKKNKGKKAGKKRGFFHKWLFHGFAKATIFHPVLPQAYRYLCGMVTAILLAAGSSRRMGAYNKLLLPWKGKPLVVATTENIIAAGVDDLVLVTGHEAEAITAAVSGLPVRVIHNPHYAAGMTGSIQTGISAASGNGYMICLADMVSIEPEEYVLLVKAFKDEYSRDIECILLPEYQGQKGNPVLFASSWREAILRHPEEDGCRTLVRSHPVHQHRIPMPTAHVLQDIDTPDEYHRLIHHFA
jgi:molybdenum cofactor cytidylyltransferase